MNRAYRRSKLKEQRRKNKEHKMFKTLCNDSYQMFRNCLEGAKQKTELLPCPFCGSTNLRYDGYWCIDFDGFYVRCLKCDSSGTPKGTKSAAKNAWNKRIQNNFKE